MDVYLFNLTPNIISVLFHINCSTQNNPNVFYFQMCYVFSLMDDSK